MTCPCSGKRQLLSNETTYTHEATPKAEDRLPRARRLEKRRESCPRLSDVPDAALLSQPMYSCSYSLQAGRIMKENCKTHPLGPCGTYRPPVRSCSDNPQLISGAKYDDVCVLQIVCRP